MSNNDELFEDSEDTLWEDEGDDLWEDEGNDVSWESEEPSSEEPLGSVESDVWESEDDDVWEEDIEFVEEHLDADRQDVIADTKDADERVTNALAISKDNYTLSPAVINISDIVIPVPVKDIETREVLHNNLCEREKIKDFVREQLK